MSWLGVLANMEAMLFGRVMLHVEPQRALVLGDMLGALVWVACLSNIISFFWCCLGPTPVVGIVRRARLLSPTPTYSCGAGEIGVASLGPGGPYRLEPPSYSEAICRDSSKNWTFNGK